jgi:hypothetical protein
MIYHRVQDAGSRLKKVLLLLFSDVIINMELLSILYNICVWSKLLDYGQIYEGVSQSFQTDCPEQELQMVQLSVTRCSCITILWVGLVSFATIILCVASQVFIVVSIDFIINSVWKLLDTPSYFILS